MRNLIEPDIIQRRVHDLGAELTSQYEGRPLTVVGVLTGCMLFLADLVRAISVPHRIGVVHASSYRGPTTERGDLRVDTTLLTDVRDRDVLIVDDIFDTGQTLKRLVSSLQSAGARSVHTAVLLVKEGRSEVDVSPDHHCFQIPDVFVVGYGLDYNDDYRHLPHIAALDESDL